MPGILDTESRSSRSLELGLVVWQVLHFVLSHLGVADVSNLVLASAQSCNRLGLGLSGLGACTAVFGFKLSLVIILSHVQAGNSCGGWGGPKGPLYGNSFSCRL